MKKSIIVDTKTILDLFCEINNLLVGCSETGFFGKIERDTMDIKMIIGRNQAVKGRMAHILNKELDTTVFTENIIPFEIKVDQVIKILEKGKL